ncbi:polyglutamate biosynthesis protein [Paecilomyces variotii No. 5]|uniref:Polyglutamate biosynthesis protein n=1 Tax=Byssochlamys spectabilis (strain No. 5 / NBRC 109023) TaxID=1356009 RepID=V5FK07_BYSSN|nr:polyglutamate biosynthesis protein [Paecilomyces variotii No. 5]
MSNPRIFHLNFVGDVMLGRLVDQLFPQHVDSPSESRLVASFISSNPHLRNYTPASPWGSTLPLFHAADLNIINLETAITIHNVAWPHKTFNYRMHPANAAALKEARVDYASLANNHTLDFSTEGLIETVWTLRKARIAFAGAGETTDEAFRPAVLCLPRRQYRYTASNGEGDQTSAQGATTGHSSKYGNSSSAGECPETSHTIHVYSAADHPRDWASVPTFHFIDYTARTFKKLKGLLTNPSSSHSSSGEKQEEKPSLKIFSVHWGPNYAWHPHGSTIRSLAHFLIDECGVDIVHGHSSHHIQGVERYKNKLIIYGCGDFIDDYALNEEFRNDLGAVWRVVVREGSGSGSGFGSLISHLHDSDAKQGKKKGAGLELVRLEIFPTRCDRFQAMLLDREDRDHAWVREKIRMLSADLGTRVRQELGEEGQVIVDLEG